MSDLASDNGSASTTDIVMVTILLYVCNDYSTIQEPQGSDNKLEKKLNSIMNDVDTLKNEVHNCISVWYVTHTHVMTRVILRSAYSVHYMMQN